MSAATLQDDAAALGLTIEGGGDEDDPTRGYFGVWQENWSTVELFNKLSTQWRLVAGFAGVRYLGLDYTAALALIAHLGIRRPRETFAGLQVMERAALALLNKS